MSNLTKHQWIDHIRQAVETSHFTCRLPSTQNIAPLLFASDVFRRSNHQVVVSIEPSETGVAIINVFISQNVHSSIECTISKMDSPVDTIRKLNNPTLCEACIRGCGTTVNIVAQIVAYAIHHGWYVHTSNLGTLSQTIAETTQRNTTWKVVMRRGS